MTYLQRLIDKHLLDWKNSPSHKPLLLRGARQVGKSTAIRHLGELFGNFVEINFERQPDLKSIFQQNLDVKRIVSQLSVIVGSPIVAGKTLLFFDEIQACPEAIMSLRFFKEDMPDLHVAAAGSLLEFALEELPTFGVGRIHSMFMYPMTFDEFLQANGEQLLIEARNHCSPDAILPEALYDKIVGLFRTYMLVGGMPEAVARWISTHDFLQCQEVQDDIVVSYEADFPKYKKKVDPILLRMTLRSAAVQCSKKFVYSEVGGGYKTEEVKRALELLILAGLLVPVTRTGANGLPLGSESDMSFRKILVFDCGLTLRLLNMSLGDISELTQQILTASVSDLVNKVTMAEQIAGLEMIRYQSPNMRHELYFWMRASKNAQAEVDYVTSFQLSVLPIEIKAGMQGGMKSLWLFMREKNLNFGIRSSLENFGRLKYIDPDADKAIRHVNICPLYALSQLPQIASDRL